MQSAIVRGGVRLPSSGPRKSRDKFIKLLRDVDPDAEHGFGFNGAFLRPGAVVTDAELRPDDAYPAIPILLEHMQCAPAFATGGVKRLDSLYILWRYDEASGGWRELGRSSSASWQWALDMRPLALRALQEARGGAVAVILPDLPAIARRIATALDAELKGLEDGQRVKVIGVVHDELAARLSS